LGLDPDQLRDFLASGCERRGDALVNRATGRRVAAVMPVHLYGHPVDLDLITAVAEEFGLALVEDGAEALGAKYKGKMLGATSRLFGLSFNGNKIITTGGGGMVLTSDDDIAKRLRYLSAQSRDDKVEFAHGEVGYNYRMPNLCAAFGLGQFEAIDTLLARKRAIANRYRDALMDIDGVDVRGEANWAENSQWMSILTLDGAKFPEGSAPLRQALVAGVVEARPIWQPLHRQKAFAGCHALTIERAEAVYRAGMCLPCSTGLTDADQDRVIAVIREHLEGVS
ncbi:MAG: DegT/DnrJ/EryC1/StrS family aminotransferase, partial [Rhodospirillaceae bacterium]